MPLMLTSIVHDSCYGASIALNALLIIIIIARTPSYLRSYSIILFYISIVELTTAISSLLIFIKVMYTHAYSVNVVCGVCRHWGSPSICYYLNTIRLAGISHYTVLVAFCSCYRYYVLAHSRGEPKGRNVILAFFVIQLPTICIFTNFARESLLEGATRERTMNAMTARNWLGSYWLQWIIVPVCIIVLTSAVRINAILSSLGYMSEKNKRRHANILRALLCQTSLPVLYAMSVVAYRTRRNVASEELYHLTSMIGSLITFLSPLFTIIFTIPYREAVGRFFQSGEETNESNRVIGRADLHVFSDISQSDYQCESSIRRVLLTESFQDISHAFQIVITVLSLAINLLLLRIIFTSQRREIGAYRYLIASFAVSDLIYSIIHWLVYPIPEMYKNAFLLSGHGIFNSRLGSCIYAGVYSQSTPILVFHFVYRTLNIRSPAHISRPAILFSAMIAATALMNLNGQERCLAFPLVSLFACRIFVMHVLMRPDDETLTAIAPLFVGNTTSPLVHSIETATNHIQALYWSGETFARPRWRNLIGAFDAMTFVTSTYTIIIICAYLINKSLKKHSRSSKTIGLQQQLYRSLLYQAIYPGISTYFPLGVSMFMPIFGFAFDWVPILCPPLCVCHPLFDAVVLIFCISIYRSAFLRYIGLSRFITDQTFELMPRARRQTLPSL